MSMNKRERNKLLNMDDLRKKLRPKEQGVYTTQDIM